MTFPKAIFAAGLALFAVCSPCRAVRPSSWEVRKNGTTGIYATLGRHRVAVVFETAIVPLPPPEARATPNDAAAVWACTGGRIPCSLTLDAWVVVDGSRVQIPAAELVALGDPVSVLVRAGRDKAVVVEITGGDAAYTYLQVFVIRGRQLVESRYYSGMDTVHPLAITHYFQPPLFN